MPRSYWQPKGSRGRKAASYTSAEAWETATPAELERKRATAQAEWDALVEVGDSHKMALWLQEHGYRLRDKATAEKEWEIAQERETYARIVDDAVVRLKAMGFVRDRELLSRGHKGLQYVQTFRENTIYVGFGPRSMVSLLGFKDHPYRVQAWESVGVRILKQRKSSPKTIKGFQKAVNTLLQELRPWIIDAQRRTGAPVTNPSTPPTTAAALVARLKF